MVKKRNGKAKLINGSAIILNENDRQKRIAVLRGNIIAGNDNKTMHDELQQLTNQQINISNKTPEDLYNDLRDLTPILKTITFIIVFTILLITCELINIYQARNIISTKNT